MAWKIQADGHSVHQPSRSARRYFYYGASIDEVTRINEPIGEDRCLQEAALAYIADATLVDHVLLPHGYRWQDDRLTGASLDHSMWFHQEVLADEWLLYEQRVETTGGSRGLASGRFFDSAGNLVATCMQEGLIRWDR